MTTTDLFGTSQLAAALQAVGGTALGDTLNPLLKQCIVAAANNAGGGGAAWGSITGTLSAQTDLQAALDAKAPINIPQNSQSADYTAVITDAAKQIFHPAADNNARTFTLPANASVAFDIGTTITFINMVNTVTIAINSDTLIMAGSGSTGSRTLAANGIATAVKITSTSWLINGTNLS